MSNFIQAVVLRDELLLLIRANSSINSTLSQKPSEARRFESRKTSYFQKFAAQWSSNKFRSSRFQNSRRLPAIAGRFGPCRRFSFPRSITSAFEQCEISEKLPRIAFFESDGTAVNSGIRAGVIAMLQQKLGRHIKFFWCLSHRLELAIKEAIQNEMKDVETAMRDLYYIYQNSGKRLRELRSLHDILKDVYSFENGQVKPSKASGTRWIDHKLRATKAFVDKRGLYLAHIQNVIADTSKANDKASRRKEEANCPSVSTSEMCNVC